MATFFTPPFLIHSDKLKDFGTAVPEAVQATGAFTPTTIQYNLE